MLLATAAAAAAASTRRGGACAVAALATVRLRFQTAASLAPPTTTAQILPTIFPSPPTTAPTLGERYARRATAQGLGGGAGYATAGSSGSSSSRGELPKEGPEHAKTVGVPFLVTRAQADESFKAFHSRHWLQNPSLPRWAAPADEVYLPFWLGEATVQVELHSAEVGRDEVVRRFDGRTGRYDTRYETVWRRVELGGTGWRFHHAPEDPSMQLYASYKYPRGDAEALRPGSLIGRAQRVTPEMLQAGPGAPSDTRRVGAFTVTPDVARKLLKGRVESAERQRAEQQISAATGYPHVRFVQMTLTWLGPAAGEGPRLSPLYAPAYVYSYSHAGVKVRSFVSGVDGRASGVHYLDDSKMAALATLAAGGLLLFTGAAGALSPMQLFFSALVAPFFASSLLARFWPAIRGLWLTAKGRLQQAWDTRGGGGGAAETSWSADFVGAYSRQEEARRRAEEEERQRAEGEDGAGPSFEDLFRDPLGWVEREMKRAQRRAQQRAQREGRGFQEGGGSSYEDFYRRQQQQQQQQWQRQGGRFDGGGGGGRPGASAGPPGDPQGFYRTLGVKPTATTADIAEAFRGLALKTHPDRAPEAQKAEATRKFQELTAAYQVLRDPKRRARYDSTGSA